MSAIQKFNQLVKAGHSLDGAHQAQHWYGKRYGTANEAYPLLFWAPGEKFWHDDPAARVRMVEVRGRSMASMICNKWPTIDSFVKVDDNTLFDEMDWRDMIPAKFYFNLRRDNNPPPEIKP